MPLTRNRRESCIIPMQTVFSLSCAVYLGFEWHSLTGPKRASESSLWNLQMVLVDFRMPPQAVLHCDGRCCVYSVSRAGFPPIPTPGMVWYSSVLQGEVLIPTGKKISIESLGWHTFRHRYHSMLDVCGAPIGVQQKLMRHAQVSTTMQYGNAYMSEKRKAHGAVVQMVLPSATTMNAEISSVSA